jgi:ribosomal protein S18 acetylase RimI-like enzyme
LKKSRSKDWRLKSRNRRLTRWTNSAALSFYKKLGFVKVSELQFPYGETVGTNFVLKTEL